MVLLQKCQSFGIRLVMKYTIPKTLCQDSKKLCCLSTFGFSSFVNTVLQSVFQTLSPSTIPNGLVFKK